MALFSWNHENSKIFMKNVGILNAAFISVFFLEITIHFKMSSYIRSLHAFLHDKIRRGLDKCREQNPDEFDMEETRMNEKEIKIQSIGTQKMKVNIELIMCFICKEPLQDPRVTFCCENLICFKCFPERGSKKCCSGPCTKIKLEKPSGFYLKKLKTVMFKCTAQECQVWSLSAPE